MKKSNFFHVLMLFIASIPGSVLALQCDLQKSMGPNWSMGVEAVGCFPARTPNLTDEIKARAIKEFCLQQPFLQKYKVLTGSYYTDAQNIQAFGCAAKTASVVVCSGSDDTNLQRIGNNNSWSCVLGR